jgi:hypothetical protein
MKTFSIPPVSTRGINLLIFILLSFGITGCLNQEKKDSQPETSHDQPAFQSQLEEPWKAYLYQFDRWYDFRPDRYAMPDLTDTSSRSRVYKIEIITEDQLKDLLLHLSNLQNLEAIKLTGLDFQEQQPLTSLFNQLSSLPHLKKLILTQCRVKDLPREIHLLKKLRTLDLSFNELVTLPEEIGKLEKLEYLRVYNNRRFRTFPSNLGKLKNLLTLDFAGTSIRELPESLSGCQSLQHITGNACRLEKIPAAIGLCHKLKYLNLAANRIRNIAGKPWEPAIPRVTFTW